MKVKPYVYWLVLALAFSGLAMVIYWPARTGAWVLDDIPNIVLNQRLRDFSDSFQLLLERRGISFFSFALNIKLWGLEPAAFRWVNVVIHVVNSLLVVLLLRQLTGSAWRWAIVGGLFFLCHPVQTSAVSYIVQRMSLLSAFFALTAILLVDRYYLLVGEGRGAKAKLFLLISVFCVFFSFMSKENAVLLPLMFLLLAWFRGEGRLAAGWRSVVVVWLAISVVAIFSQYNLVVQHFTGAATSDGFSGIPFYKDTGQALYAMLADQDRAFLSIRYFLSQLEVFWVYLGLIFFPLRQALDYSWPIPDLRLSLLHLATLALIVVGLWFACKRRDRFPSLFFGLAWIAIFSVIESSFIPLDPIFEHRLYLPLIGVIFIFRDLGALLPKKTGWIVAVVVICLLALLSWKRNMIWGGDPASFWQNDVSVVPRAPRPVFNHAAALFAQKRFVEAEKEIKLLRSQGYIYDMTVGEVLYFSGKTEEAMAVFRRAVERGEPGANGVELFSGYQAIQDKKYAEAKDWLGRAELRKGQDVKSLYFKGMLAEAQNDPIGAVENYHAAIAASEGWYESAIMTVNSGYALWAQERRDLLLAQLSEWLDSQRVSIQAAPDNMNIRMYYANQLMRLGLYEEALTHYEALKEMTSTPGSLYAKLGMVSEKLRRLSAAEKYYKKSYESFPNSRDNAFNYARMLLTRGNLSAANEVVTVFLQRNPNDGLFLLLSGDVLLKRGEIVAARDAYLRASLQPGYQGLALPPLRILNSQLKGVKNE